MADAIVLALGRVSLQYWAQKRDAVQLVRPMSQFDGFVRPFLHYKL